MPVRHLSMPFFSSRSPLLPRVSPVTIMAENKGPKLPVIMRINPSSEETEFPANAIGTHKIQVNTKAKAKKAPSGCLRMVVTRALTAGID